MKNFFFIGCLFLTLSARAQQKPKDQALADSLAQWTVLDQTAAGPRQGRFKDMSSEDRKRYTDSVFTINERRLKKIFAQHGFPGYDLVGEQGSTHFWLMIQHCDQDPAFQEQVLSAMQAQLKHHNADPKNFAYLTDRVRINTNRKQLYGTQVSYNTDSCQAVPKPLADSLNVNQRRKEIGLEPLESYLNWMSEAHFEMNKGVYEKKGIHHAKLIAEPK